MHEIGHGALEPPPQDDLAGLEHREQGFGRDHVEAPGVGSGHVRPGGEPTPVGGDDAHREPPAGGEAERLEGDPLRCVGSELHDRRAHRHAVDRPVDFRGIGDLQEHGGRGEAVVVGDRAHQRQHGARRDGSRDARHPHRHLGRRVVHRREHEGDGLAILEPVGVDESRDERAVSRHRPDRRGDRAAGVRSGERSHDFFGAFGDARHARRGERLGGRAGDLHDRSCRHLHDPRRRRLTPTAAEILGQRIRDLEPGERGRVDRNEPQIAQPGIAATDLEREVVGHVLEHVAEGLRPVDDAAACAHPIAPPAPCPAAAEIDDLGHDAVGGRLDDHVDIAAPGHDPPPVHEAFGCEGHLPRPRILAKHHVAPHPQIGERRPGERQARDARHAGEPAEHEAHEPAAAEELRPVHLIDERRSLSRRPRE